MENVHDEEAALDRLKGMALQIHGVVYQYRRRPDGSHCLPYVGDALFGLLGLTPEEVREDASPLFALIHPGDLDACVESIRLSARDLTPWGGEFRVTLRDGSRRWIGANSVPHREADGSTLWHGFITDATERKLMESELRESRLLTEKIIATVPVRVFWKDRDLVYLGCNAMFAQDAGYADPKDIVGKDDFGLAWRSEAESYRADDRAVIEGGLPKLLFEETQTTPNGGKIVLLTSKTPLRDSKGEVIGVLGSYVDVTELKRAEENRAKLQRLESLGMLAGGIAHDFNNILTAIVGNLCLLESETQGGAAAELIREAQAACDIAKGLSNQLLTFAKGGAPIVKTLDLRSVIREAASFASRGTSARCVFDLGESPLVVAADEVQVSQVIQNLVLNAAQAMPLGGTVTLRAAGVAAGPPGDPGGGGRRFVRVTVEDEGPGVPAEHRASIFDPYFSTKALGRGLGLAMCHSIMGRHGGSIAVDADAGAGAGATFVLRFPAESVAAVTPEAPQAVPASRRGRVLIMDDEPSVSMVLKRMLERMGCRARTVADGAAAVSAYGDAMKDGERYDGVILDLTIRGGVGGREVLEMLKALDPEVRALISSGYSNAPIMAEYAANGFRGVLRKPYRNREVSESIGLLLDGSGASGGAARPTP